MIRDQSASENGRDEENIVALAAPSATESVDTPTRSNSSCSTGLPRITPIDPVIVAGWATITSAGADMKYPPDAATSPIDTTTGLPAARTRTTSRQMTSDAVAEPPGLFTRSTTARAPSSAAAARSAAATVSEPIPPPPGPPRPLRPDLIAPCA